MSWNEQELRERFAFRENDAERQIRQLRKKAETKDAYKSLHDRQIGAHEVFIVLKTSAALTSWIDFLAELKSMKTAMPTSPTGAFDVKEAKRGRDETLDALLIEFGQ